MFAFTAGKPIRDDGVGGVWYLPWRGHLAYSLVVLVEAYSYFFHAVDRDHEIWFSLHDPHRFPIDFVFIVIFLVPSCMTFHLSKLTENEIVLSFYIFYIVIF